MLGLGCENSGVIPSHTHHFVPSREYDDQPVDLGYKCSFPPVTNKTIHCWRTHRVSYFLINHSWRPLGCDCPRKATCFAREIPMGCEKFQMFCWLHLKCWVLNPQRLCLSGYKHLIISPVKFNKSLVLTVKSHFYIHSYGKWEENGTFIDELWSLFTY